MNGDGKTSAGHLGLAELLTHAGWLRRLAVSLVGDPDAAEDVVQGTLVNAWARPPSTDRHDSVRPWLAEVARNQAHDLRRAEGRRQARQEVAAAEGGPIRPPSPSTPEQLIGDLEIHRTVAALVTALPEPYRETLVLHFYEGLPAADIARRLGSPAGTIRWRLKEGLDRLRAALDAHHQGDRRSWQRALLPLVPPALAGPGGGGAGAMAGAAAAGGAGLGGASRAGLGGLAGLGLGTLVLGAAVILAVTLWPERRSSEDARPLARPGIAARAGAPAGLPGAATPAALPRFKVLPTAEQDPDVTRTLSDSERLLHGLLAAVVDNNYDAFLFNSDDLHKAGFRPDLMQDLATGLGPHLRGGYQLRPLGSLNKTIRKISFTLYLWKVEFRDGSADRVLTVGLRDGRVLSFEEI